MAGATAKAATSAPPPAAAAAADLAQKLTAEQMGGLVVIEGDKGVATGSITRIHDTDCVVTQTSGKINGLGPTRLEVDAPFQPGNSGSPIFDVNCGLVVGVATYAETINLDLNHNPISSTTAKTTTGAKLETRWFGCRLDSVEKWETIDWAKWRAQVQRVADFHETSLAIYAVYRGDLYEGAKNPRLRGMIERYQTKMAEIGPGANQAGSSPATLGPTMDLLRFARALAEEGTKDFATGIITTTSAPACIGRPVCPSR